MTELKPCPFCGGKIEARPPHVTLAPGDFIPLLFCCDDCGAMVSFDNQLANIAQMHGDNSPAIILWNSRHGKTCFRCGAKQVDA